MTSVWAADTLWIMNQHVGCQEGCYVFSAVKELCYASHLLISCSEIQYSLLFQL